MKERIHERSSTPLDEYLLACARADSWRVDRVLKESAFETTEVVYFQGSHGGELGPFVRKRIDCSAGVGSAYEDLWRAQRSGVALRSVPRIVECVRTGDTLAVVMEFVEGPTLAEYVKRTGASVDLALHVLPELCHAVSDLHELLPQPLIHRDLKPSNVIMSPSGPIIIDFGIARMWRLDAECDTAHFGTRAYAPPEQFGFGQTDERSDVYALGKLLYFCAVGEEPPRISSADELMALGLPSGLSKIVSQATQLDPQVRFASAHALERAILSQCTAGETGHVSRFERNDAGAGEGALMSSSAGDTPISFSNSIPAAPSESPTTRSQRFWASLAKTPHWLGKVWNVLVMLTFGLLVLGSIFAIVQPNADDAALPLWFRIVEYVLIVDVGLAPVTYLFLDKRRLYESHPLLKVVTFRLQLLICFVVAVACSVVTFLASAAAGIQWV
ncbi:serine/threonine-protein kinase [Collinsella tanakaei]|uniref:serine/threonine protein kinase n=1 Tax=Collinsella tanakaei TaxID=626935 RepID=UPI0025A32A97|nr:serine/threonine-protein kinase [Collinsella tanakaei]MDM8245531.1 serine/threonine-protein kinase [Collinsella tanakaei]